MPKKINIEFLKIMLRFNHNFLKGELLRQ